MDEIWRIISDTKYSISSMGNVQNSQTGLFLTPTPNSRGYLSVMLYTDGIRQTARVHRLAYIR